MNRGKTTADISKRAALATATTTLMVGAGRGLFFERTRSPLRAATAETVGVTSCESLQLIASLRAHYVTVADEKSRTVFYAGLAAAHRLPYCLTWPGAAGVVDW